MKPELKENLLTEKLKNEIGDLELYRLYLSNDNKNSSDIPKIQGSHMAFKNINFGKLYQIDCSVLEQLDAVVISYDQTSKTFQLSMIIEVEDEEELDDDKEVNIPFITMRNELSKLSAKQVIHENDYWDNEEVCQVLTYHFDDIYKLINAIQLLEKIGLKTDLTLENIFQRMEQFQHKLETELPKCIKETNDILINNAAMELDKMDIWTEAAESKKRKQSNDVSDTSERDANERNPKKKKTSHTMLFRGQNKRKREESPTDDPQNKDKNEM